MAALSLVPVAPARRMAISPSPAQAQRRAREEGQMAYASTHSAVNESRGDSMSAASRNLSDRFVRYLAYRRTVRVLEALGSRTLTDCGMTKASIRQRAHEAVYGA